MNNIDRRVNIILLAAGLDQSNQRDGYPLCLSEINSVPLIQKIINQTNQINKNRLIVNFRESEANKYHLDNIVRLLNPDSKVVKIPSDTQGASCTALMSINDIDNDDNLLIINGNEYIDVDFTKIINGFINDKLDGGVVVFKSVHPRYSFVKINEKKLVVEASEKNPISNLATTGFYWFSKGKDFVNAAKSCIRKDARVNNMFYICPTFNEMILKNKIIGIHEIDEKLYHPIKSERQLENFENRKY
jgi:dTDP-glucose pyrophosphorylase